jgi:hypothetical protein
MKRFIVHTLVDITETRVYRHQDTNPLAKSQQQNFLTLLQTIGLRVNPAYTQSPICEETSLKQHSFGSDYTGNHNLWTFEFTIEYEDGFTDEQGNEAGLLIRDLHFVPIITDLEETINIRLPVFDTTSTDYRNTLIYPQAG